VRERDQFSSHICQAGGNVGDHIKYASEYSIFSTSTNFNVILFIRKHTVKFGLFHPYIGNYEDV
jgi:hypothetical protein